MTRCADMIAIRTPRMTDDQEALKTEYRRLLKERAVLKERLNTEAARWNGKGEKPRHTQRRRGKP